MFRRMVMLITPLTMLSLSGCGSETPTGATEPTASTSSTSPTVTHVVSPDPATARPSSDPSYQWATSFNVTLTEGAGVAVTIRSLTADLQQTEGGIVITPPAGLDEVFRFQVKASGNRLGANGSLAIDFDFMYTLPNGGREALVTITLSMANDQGTPHSKTVQVKVL